MLISPQEPPAIRALGKVSSAPERVGADILMASKRKVGVQRKRFPEDLIASLSDGRLSAQLHQMSALDHALVLLEGHGQWHTDGSLIAAYGQTFTKPQLYGLIFSVAWEFGYPVVQVRDIEETKVVLRTLEAWAKKDHHRSLRVRPNPTRQSAWGEASDRDWATHLIQSFPGIGPGTAEAIYEYFGRAPLRWDLADPATELQAVPGVGKGRATTMAEALS